MTAQSSAHDNILLYDSEYHPNVVNGESGRRPPTVIPRVDSKLSGEYLHLGTVWSGNYYHWVLDVLPRLLFAERFDRLSAMPMIVQRDIMEKQRESLQILGVPSDQIIEFNAIIGTWSSFITFNLAGFSILLLCMCSG
jgi:capsular polysaccharide biosynthesis protein